MGKDGPKVEKEYYFSSSNRWTNLSGE